MKTVKRHTNFYGLVTLRNGLGITQQQLADQLEVSRSTIVLAEHGKRSLSTAVLLKVAQLQIKLHEANSRPKEKIIAPHPAEHYSASRCQRIYALLFARESFCRLKVRKLTADLERMAALYQKTRDWLGVIENSLHEEQDQSVGNNWWKNQQQSAIKILNTCCLPMQILLRSRIRLLNAEAELNKDIQQQLKEELDKFFVGKDA